MTPPGAPDQWEREASRWDAYNAAVWGRLRLDLIHHHIGPLLTGGGQRVLDIGCGTGETAVFCARSGAEVTAVDRSPAMLERAARSARAEGVGLAVVQADAADFAGGWRGVFDLVFCHNVLAYVEDARTLVTRLAALVAPGGRLSLVVNNSLAEPLRFALFHHDLREALRWARESPESRPGKTFDHPLRVYDPGEVAAWMRGGGLSVGEAAGMDVVAPYLPNDVKERSYGDLVALELQLGAMPAYAALAVHVLLLGRRPGAAGATRL